MAERRIDDEEQDNDDLEMEFARVRRILEEAMQSSDSMYDCLDASMRGVIGEIRGVVCMCVCVYVCTCLRMSHMTQRDIDDF